MVWEGVPWMVAGGEHSAEVGRLLAFAATSAGEGVVGVADCRVVASAIPDGNVNINPGAIGVLNRFAGGASQSYLVRNVGAQVQAMTPQGSSGARYDLVCVIIEDPQYPGQPDPPSVTDGPYVRTAVYEDVPAGTVSLQEVDPGQSGYALARVKFDASDGTVNQADITDLRDLLNPRVAQFKRILNVAGAGVQAIGGDAIVPTGADWQIPVPKWATKVQLEAQWSGLFMSDTGAGNGVATGNGRVTLGALTTANALWRETAFGANNVTRASHMAADELVVPSAIRGTTQALQARLSKTGGAGLDPKADQGTTVVVTATFYEEAGTGLD